MKKIIQKALVFIGGVVLAASLLQMSEEVYAAPSDKQVKEAYKFYLEEQIGEGVYENGIDYSMYDFNKDGVKELVVCKLSKKKFIEKMKTYYGSNDKIVIKNGKVQKVFIGMQVAG